MPTPVSAGAMLKALKAEGVKVKEYAGWTTRERDAATGKIFGPVNGVMIHHTAGTDSLALCVKGTADLPGPLCHAHLAKNGTLTLISNGRANHAGSGRQSVYDAVVAERTFTPSGGDSVDGNDHFYGLEIENRGNGKDPYPSVQYDQAVRYATAICRLYGWNEKSVIGHKEWTGRKIDPSFSMSIFRAEVKERLAHKADWTKSAAPATPPPAQVPVSTVEQRLTALEARVKRLETEE